MRYGIISDIHGNLEALSAVLEAMASERIDAYLCIGDIVGYGANPKECIKAVESLRPELLIAGNHEWGVVDFLDIDYFAENAAKAINWTKDILSDDEKEYLRSFKLLGNIGHIVLVHGSLDAPEDFNYIVNSVDVDKTLKLLKQGICFVGHSHYPGIFCLKGGSAVAVEGFKAGIEDGRKYVVNAGSVGQPRDKDPRASFVVYDEDTAFVEIKRVDYNIKEAQRKIIAAGLPDELALRLAEGR